MKDSDVIAEHAWEDTQVRNQYFFSVLPGILKKTSITPAAIDIFVTGLGPGSFSGLRCTLSAINGLALPDKKRVFGITSPEIMAWQIIQETAKNSVTVLGDARRGYIWHACYDRTKELPAARNLVSIIPVDQLSAKLGESEVIVTSDWDRIGKFLKEISPSGTLIEERCVPSARSAGELAFRKISMNLPSEPLLPIYLHPPVAARSISSAK